MTSRKTSLITALLSLATVGIIGGQKMSMPLRTPIRLSGQGCGRSHRRGSHQNKETDSRARNRMAHKSRILNCKIRKGWRP
jgi:hypothetical protein